MKVSELKDNVLSYLADQYEQGNPGMVDLEPLAKKLGLPFDSLRPVIGMLHQQEVLKTVIGEQHAMLTPRGIEIAMPLDPAVPKQPPQTVNFNGAISQSAIAMNQGRANVSVSNTKVESFIANLSQEIDKAEGVSEDKKESWKNMLFEISKHPAIGVALTKILGG